MPFILSNGEIYDDEEILGAHIYDYDYDYDSDDEHEDFEEIINSELIDRFEFRLAMTAH